MRPFLIVFVFLFACLIGPVPTKAKAAEFLVRDGFGNVQVVETPNFGFNFLALNAFNPNVTVVRDGFGRREVIFDAGLRREVILDRPVFFDNRREFRRRR